MIDDDVDVSMSTPVWRMSFGNGRVDGSVCLGTDFDRSDLIRSYWHSTFSSLDVTSADGWRDVLTNIKYDYPLNPSDVIDRVNAWHQRESS